MMFEQAVKEATERQGYTLMAHVDDEWMLIGIVNPELIRRIKVVLRAWEKDKWAFMEPNP